MLSDYVLLASLIVGFVVGLLLAGGPVDFWKIIGSVSVLTQSGVASIQLYYAAEVRATLGTGFVIFPPNNPYIGYYADVGQVLLIATLALFFAYLTYKLRIVLGKGLGGRKVSLSRFATLVSAV